MTTKKNQTKTETAAPETSKKRGRSSATPGDKADNGYADNFRNWELAVVEPGPVTVKTASIITIFDTRAEPPAKIDHLIAATKSGITTSIRITKMKFLGEDGAYAVSPVPGETVKLKKGEVYTVDVFGRCRIRAALHHGFKEMEANLAQYSSWGEMVRDASSENSAREDPTQWDLSTTVRNLQLAGKTQDEIAELLPGTVSAGKVSHLVAVFALPEPVQALYRDGAITSTHARALRPIAADTDWVIKLANQAHEKGLSGDDIKKIIDAKKAAAADAETGKKEAKKIRVRASDYSTIKLKAQPEASVRTVLGNLDFIAKTKAAQAKNEEDAEKKAKLTTRAAYLKGLKEGFLMSFGVEAIPESYTREDEPEEADAS